MHQKQTTKPGDRYGKLTVCEESKSQRYGKFKYLIWHCRCDCGVEKWVKGCNLRAGRCQSCGCSRSQNQNWGQKAIARNSKYFFRSWLAIWRSKSNKRRDMEFTLTLEQLDELFDQQNGRCYYTGEKLILATGAKFAVAETNISIDRIDNAKGYTIDNIVLCTKLVNISRNLLTQSEFIKMAYNITRHHTEPETATSQAQCYDDTLDGN